MFSPKVLKGAAAPHSIFCSPTPAARKASSHQAYFNGWRQNLYHFLPSPHARAMSRTPTQAGRWCCRSASCSRRRRCEEGVSWRPPPLSSWLWLGRAAPLLLTQESVKMKNQAWESPSWELLAGKVWNSGVGREWAWGFRKCSWQEAPGPKPTLAQQRHRLGQSVLSV